MDAYQQYIHKSRYARYLPEKNRREHWEETVDRFINFVKSKVSLNDEVINELREAIINHKVMPSMRSVMTAGIALERDSTCGYNCSYLPIDDPKSFDEAMVILMNGTGVGFSVERQYVNKLPEIPDRIYDSETIINVRDSKEGWGKALRMLIALLYSGENPTWNLSNLRPAGAKLKTFGGRSSGSEPLNELFHFVVNIFKNAVGRKLTSLECHDIMCKIGEVVVVGGVRRSAMISLSNLSDDRMRNAKSGAWWEQNVQRALSNNSAVYTEKPDVNMFLQEWLALYESKSGERGIFNREASQEVARQNGRRDSEQEFGTNPCCLPGDTQLKTLEYGLITIKEVVELIADNKEVTVLSHNLNDGVSEFVPVEAAKMTRPDAELIELEIETLHGTKTLKLTPDHKVFSKNRGYIRADELDENDELIISVGIKRMETITGKLKSKRVVTNEDTYDIQTENNNFYANDVLVHNSEIILRPYQFCVSPNTPLITKENGIQPISSFVDRQVSIWNGEEWTPVTVRKTGTNQKLMRVYLNDGSYLDCTPDHRWSVKDRFSEEWKEVETKDLMNVSKYSLQVEPCNTIAPVGGVNVDSAYTMGFAVGDGCVYKNQTLIDLHGSKDWMCPVEGIRHKKQLNQTGTSEYIRCNATEFAKPDLILSLKENGDAWTELLGSWNKESVMSFVAGLADADGSETGTGGIRIYINSYDKGRALQLLLAKFGVRCSINLHQKEGTSTNLCVRKRDSWYVQITNCADIPCHRLDVSEGHEPKFKGKYQNIVRVEELEGLHDTYCFNEPKRHKGMFGNVLTYQCNLSEVIARSSDTEEDLINKVRIATILGTIQSTFTYFPYLRKIWKKNTEEERLLGVSLTGIYDCPLLNNYKDPELSSRLERLRQVAIDTNKEYAELLGIPISAAITCVKPSGCTTLETEIMTEHGKRSMAEIFSEYSDANIFECHPGTWLELNKTLKVWDENYELQNVTKLFVNGMSEVYEIEDDIGNIYKFTGNHMLKTTKGWKRVDELSEDDEIIQF